MREQKRQRLAAAGWKIGNAQDFLGLSDAEAALVALRVELAMLLKQTRLAHEWTQAQLAAALGSSQSRVAKMEAADASVSLDLLIKSLFAMGASGASIGAAFVERGSKRRKSA